MTTQGSTAQRAGAPATELSYDCFDCIPDYAPLRDAIAEGDWAAFSSTLAGWPTTEATHALYLMGQQDDESIEAFVAAHAEHALAKVARAYRLVTIGWRARSNATAPQVSAEQFAEFRRNLAEAERELVEACALEPELGPAWAARVLTARALSLPESEARRRYDRVQKVGGDFWAQMHLHQYLEPKWFGSVESARAFIDESLESARDGELAPVLVPLFHLERWYEKGGEHDAAAYLREAEVQAELDDAARRSVLHPARGALSPSTAAGHQIFLSLYWLAGEKRKAAVHRSALGTRTTDHHWELLAADEAGRAAIWRELTQLGGGDA